MSVDYSLPVVNELVNATNSGRLKWSGPPSERHASYNGHDFVFTGENAILVDGKVQLGYIHQFQNLMTAINTQLLDMDMVIADLKTEPKDDKE